MKEDGYAGQQQPTDTSDDFNAARAITLGLVSQMFTATEAQVVSVTNSGDLSPVGFVDVQPLVNQLDGAGKSTPHNILHRLPYFRLQGGTDAVILDPKVGDIGIVIFADRDISAVNNSKAQANPGSGRRFDMADGMYIGGVLNGTPVQYIQFNASGITIHSPTKITLSAPDIEIDASNSIKTTTPTFLQTGPMEVTDVLTSDTEVIAVTTPLHTHVHGGVVPGGADTSGPTP